MGDLSIASGTYWVKVVLHLPYMACLVMTSHLAFHMAKIGQINSRPYVDLLPCRFVYLIGDRTA